MTKEVEVIISGIQKYETHQDDDLKTKAKGEYYFRNGSHYIIFEEIIEGFTQPTKNMLKDKDGCLEMTKKGLVNTSMVFDKSKDTDAQYKTPFGEMHLGIRTKGFMVSESDKLIRVDVDYTLEAEGRHMVDCRIRIQIKACA